MLTCIACASGDANMTKTNPAPAGIDVQPVTEWMDAAVRASGGAIEPPLSFVQIPGGRSNLTFQVTDTSGNSWALRRPPTGHVLATAHDMAREHRVMSALGPSDVPVPQMIGLCTDEVVNGADFFVMEWIDGEVVRTVEDAERFPIETRRAMATSAIENLAAIHRVDIDTVGLGDFAKRTGYIERQLRRWKGQVDATNSGITDHIDRGFEELQSRMPEQVDTRLVHGDYRLDNTIVSEGGEVQAVIDWELTTLGDPLADVGALLTYWTRPGDPVVALSDAPTVAEGFPGRDEVIAIYEGALGRRIGDVDYYHAFGTWRLACILDGVVDRYRAGAMGQDDGFDIEQSANHVDDLALHALEILSTHAD